MIDNRPPRVLITRAIKYSTLREVAHCYNILKNVNLIEHVAERTVNRLLQAGMTLQ